MALPTAFLFGKLSPKDKAEGESKRNPLEKTFDEGKVRQTQDVLRDYDVFPHENLLTLLPYSKRFRDVFE